VTLLLALLLVSYLAGSVPTSIIAGQITRGIDIRDYGSGNAGATNTFRVLGWKSALVVVFVDVFKGWFAAAVIARWRFGGALGTTPVNDADLLAILCGSAAVLGHTYTVFARFRGGKGVGTLAGMTLYLAPMMVAAGLVTWLVMLVMTGYVGLSSVTAVTAFPVVVFLRDGSLNSTIGYFSLAIAGFIWFTHRSNMARLLAGNENRFEKAMIFRRSKN
jgi:glycerol-3-phosphate acyltransferase PlsY